MWLAVVEWELIEPLKNEYKVELHKIFTLLGLERELWVSFSMRNATWPTSINTYKSSCDVDNHFGLDK